MLGRACHAARASSTRSLEIGEMVSAGAGDAFDAGAARSVFAGLTGTTCLGAGTGAGVGGIVTGAGAGAGALKAAGRSCTTAGLMGDSILFAGSWTGASFAGAAGGVTVAAAILVT